MKTEEYQNHQIDLLFRKIPSSSFFKTGDYSVLDIKKFFMSITVDRTLFVFIEEIDVNNYSINRYSMRLAKIKRSEIGTIYQLSNGSRGSTIPIVNKI